MKTLMVSDINDLFKNQSIFTCSFVVDEVGHFIFANPQIRGNSPNKKLTNPKNTENTNSSLFATIKNLS